MKNNDQLKLYLDACKGLRLLYVEDNAEARLFTMEMLERFFDDITVAANGKEGLKLFKENHFDLILTDISMPKMNGLDMAKAIRNINKSITILVLSAHNETDFFISSIKLNIDGYLLKPLELKQFVETIGKVVEKINLQNEIKKYQKELESSNNNLEAKVKERTAELEYRIYHDYLTELWNHEAIMKNICCNDYEELFLIDIKGFQKLNDLYGLKSGDTILKKFAESLILFNSKNYYCLYRVYSDVFMLCRNKDSSLEMISFEESKNRLLAHLESTKIYLEDIDEEIDVEVTIGACIEKEDPLIKADMALVYAKKQNKQIVVYSKEIDSSNRLIKHLYWKSEIKKALQNDDIIPVFQGIVDKNGAIVKYEALMRLVQYNDDGEKLISPFLFLNTAMESHQYEKLTRVMIDKVFAKMAALTVDFSINLSFQDLADLERMQFLEDKIIEYDIGKRLIVEVLESEIIGEYVVVENALEVLRKYGIRVAIDDFGSGFSNFIQTFKLNPNYIKIDASLIKNILTDEKAYILVKAISDFSKDLNVEVIAEFVSSKEIFEKLQGLSIDYFQGFYFCIPSKEIETSTSSM